MEIKIFDFNGCELHETYNTSLFEQTSIIQEPRVNEQIKSIDEKIRSAFAGRPFSAKELLNELGLDWTTSRLTAYLKKLDFIEIIKNKKANQYKLKSTANTTQTKLFS